MKHLYPRVGLGLVSPMTLYHSLAKLPKPIQNILWLDMEQKYMQKHSNEKTHYVPLLDDPRSLNTGIDIK